MRGQDLCLPQDTASLLLHSYPCSSKKSPRDSDASAKDVEEDGSVTPRRRAPYHPGNEAASPGLGYGLDYHPPPRTGES